MSKAILVHARAVAGLFEHLAGLLLPRRALSLPLQGDAAAAVAAFVELWGEGDALRALVEAWPGEAAAWLVDERVPADSEASWPSGDASPGVRLVSSVHRRGGMSREAFARYWHNEHTEVALSYTVPVWRYSQNVVTEVLRGGADEDGFGVLHFKSTAELHDRWAAHPEEARRGAEDSANFMDVSRSWSVQMTETLWTR